MRVNVFKTLVISKTFMKNGLKVLYYHPLSKTKTKTKQKTKINHNNLEFYLNLYINIRQTLYLEILANLLKFAIFAKDIINQTTQQRLSSSSSAIQQLLQLIIDFFSLNIGRKRLPVLMNDFRLKTSYKNNSKASKFSKSLKTTTTTTTTLLFLNINLKTSSIKSSKQSLSATTSTTLSSSSTLPPPSSNVALFKSSNSSNNNNHHRTYNNSSKSNKVFLYYTPRDPRLRIFLKTKEIFCRSSSFYTTTVININKYLSDNKSLLNILNDLCNYGELIGGSNKNNNTNNSNNNTNNKSEQSKKSVPPFITPNNKNKNNLNKSVEICDKFPVEISDNYCVVAAAAVAIISDYAIVTISANSLIDLLTYIAAVIVSEYIAITREFIKFIAISLSFFNIQQRLKAFEVNSTIGLYENIL